MQLTIDGIPVEVLRKNIKRMHLYVLPPDGHVRVTVPQRLAQWEVEEFLHSRADWIRAHRARFAALALPSEPARFESGETVWLWGEPLSLVVIEAPRGSVAAEGSRLWLAVPPGTEVEGRRQLVREWQRRLLKEEIAARLPLWEAKTGLFCSGWQVRHATSRWGSCNVRRRTLSFNLQLAMHPKECLDYVLLHELCHLAVADHGPRFEALLRRFMPDWRRRKGLLGGR